VTLGLDIVDGPQIWKRYRQMEVDEFEDLVETAGPSADDTITAKKYLISRVYTRQLSLPMIQNDVVLREFDEFLSEHCLESEVDVVKPDQVQSKYMSAVEILHARLPFELSILNADKDSSGKNDEKVQIWKTYIRFELSEANYVRAQRLYERAILSCNDNARLALEKEYVEFAAATLKNWTLLESITRRVVVSSYNDIDLWQYRFSAVELTGQDSSIIDKLQSFALACGFSSPEDYHRILNMRCDYYRRQLLHLVGAPNTRMIDFKKNIGLLRESFSAAEQFLAQYFPYWVGGWTSLMRYRVLVEDTLISDIEQSIAEASGESLDEFAQSKKAWDRLLERCSAEASLYVEYAKWAASVARDVELARKILKKGLSATPMNAHESLCREWLNIEQHYGASVEDLLSALHKVEPKLKAAKAAAIASFSQQSTHAGSNDTPADSNYKPGLEAIAAVDKKKKPFGKKLRESVDNPVEVIGASAVRLPEEPRIKRAKVEIESASTSEEIAAQAISASVPAVESAGVFVKNVPFAASQAELSSLFGQCAGFRSCRLLVSDAGKSKGMAHVEFENASEAEAAVAQFNGYEVRGRAITVEPFKRPDGQITSNDSDDRFDPFTVFVSNLTKETTDDDLKEYFKNFGDVQIARVIVDKVTGHSKVF
jgi:hypothetical protein